ncbi:MAG TPA: enoyl-CoA hydratase-related protein [Acidimicrobiales bacterium]|nr:enoyl-CoA hydratase-related protein [Acidimicrobiales bacterium]
MTVELVKVEDNGAIRTLTLNSPANRNALSMLLLQELARGLEDASADTGVRAIVLTGSGTVFCSGADLSERDASAPNLLPEILTSIARSRAPVIARVNGHARGGGLGLIAIADMAVAPASSTFAFSEVRVGVAPAMILVPALRVTARRFLARMTLTGEQFSADDAVHGGLLTAVVADERELDDWVDRETASLLKSAPGAVAATKALLASLPDADWAPGLSMAKERSAELFAGPEATEGMDAFRTKRRPAWDATTR